MHSLEENGIQVERMAAGVGSLSDTRQGRGAVADVATRVGGPVAQWIGWGRNGVTRAKDRKESQWWEQH